MLPSRSCQRNVGSLLKPENKGKLVRILTYHVMVADFVGKTTAVATVEGNQVHVNGKHGVRVNNARA